MIWFFLLVVFVLLFFVEKMHIAEKILLTVLIILIIIIAVGFKQVGGFIKLDIDYYENSRALLLQQKREEDIKSLNTVILKIQARNLLGKEILKKDMTELKRLYTKIYEDKDAYKLKPISRD